MILSAENHSVEDAQTATLSAFVIAKAFLQTTVFIIILKITGQVNHNR